MKKIILCSVLLSIVFCAMARQKEPANNAGSKTYKRCASDEYLQELLRKDPSLKAKMDAAEARISKGMEAKLEERRNRGNQRLDAVVTIPTVVHIILSNPNIVTDADVIWQINKLNEDYAGRNADSALAGVFASSFGHSNIQFCLAQKTPNGNPTNGINRITSGVTFTQNTFNDIKHASNCGADIWDPTKYFNIWVAESTDGTLGVATFPLGGPASEQGIVLALDGFGNNPAYVAPAFNLGRTAVHEAGHFFYARHIWGDGGGCQPDFPIVSGMTGSWVDDTPTQGGPTSGCPTGTAATNCAGFPNPPGKMYQNYMDYTNDACYCMFTKNQVLRMETALDSFRASLKNSDACIPPVAVVNDAALIAVLNPSAGGCGAAANNAFCSPALTPRVTFRNYGSGNLTALKIYSQVDNLPAVATNWSGSLAPLASTSIDLASINSTGGTHVLKIYVADPNGGTDGRHNNDTITTSFTVLTPIAGPVTEGFESTTFPPPTGWKILNPNAGSITWERSTAAYKTGTASAAFRFFNYSGANGHVDYLLSPILDVVDADSVILSFERAYRLYSTSATYADTLAIVVSTDCGTTFTEVWKRGGAALATISGTTTSSYVPAAADWANTRIDLKPLIGSATSILVGFKTVNRYGQNLYIDDVNLQTFRLPDNDATARSIVEPFDRLCARTVTPIVLLANNGRKPLTSVKLLYSVSNGAVDSVTWTGHLTTGQTTNVSLKNITIPPGNFNLHTFKVYSNKPNGVDDEVPANDTTSKSVTVIDPQPAPVLEGFEQNTFPPANWSVSSSGGAYSWERNELGASEKKASAWIRNYRFNSNGKKDDLFSPLLEVGDIDSAYIRFDVSHATGKYPGSTAMPMDTLEVLVTADCGKSFRSVYKKWGIELQTQLDPNSPRLYPTNDTIGYIPTATWQWRNEFINISKWVPAKSKFQVVFRSTANAGNNTLIDNVHITSVTLPQGLKTNGYLVMPNPFQGSFAIRHLVAPANLKGMVITNAAGQVVYQRSFNGNANNWMQIDMSGKSNGVYLLKLVYDNKVITERIIKR
jgi:hypothetical protein